MEKAASQLDMAWYIQPGHVVEGHYVFFTCMYIISYKIMTERLHVKIHARKDQICMFLHL